MKELRLVQVIHNSLDHADGFRVHAGDWIIQKRSAGLWVINGRTHEALGTQVAFRDGHTFTRVQNNDNSVEIACTCGRSPGFECVAPQCIHDQWVREHVGRCVGCGAMSSRRDHRHLCPTCAAE